MRIKEHVASIKDALDLVEKRHRQTGRALVSLHAKLQAALEDQGMACGLEPGEITAFGGGTPKTPDPENP